MGGKKGGKSGGNSQRFLEDVATEAEEAIEGMKKESKSVSNRSSMEDLFLSPGVKPVREKSEEKVKKRKKKGEEATQDQSPKPERKPRGRPPGRPEGRRDAVTNVPFDFCLDPSWSIAVLSGSILVHSCLLSGSILVYSC